MRHVRVIIALAALLLTVAPNSLLAAHGGKHLSVPSAAIAGDSVVVTWANTPGNQQDWITVVKAGTSEKEWGKWTYTKGKKGGTYKVTGLTSGDYEARLYYDYPKGGFKVIERVKFSVKAGAPKGKYMSLTAGSFAKGKTVAISWFNTPGNQQDWITVVKAGKSDKDWGKWTYLKAKKSGKYDVKGLAAGSYEVRLYFNYPDGGFKVHERLKFTVK
jgi:hypothetical protein